MVVLSQGRHKSLKIPNRNLVSGWILEVLTSCYCNRPVKEGEDIIMTFLKKGGINGNLQEVLNLREDFDPWGELFSAASIVSNKIICVGAELFLFKSGSGQ